MNRIEKGIRGTNTKRIKKMEYYSSSFPLLALSIFPKSIFFFIHTKRHCLWDNRNVWEREKSLLKKPLEFTRLFDPFFLEWWKREREEERKKEWKNGSRQKMSDWMEQRLFSKPNVWFWFSFRFCIDGYRMFSLALELFPLRTFHPFLSLSLSSYVSLLSIGKFDGFEKVTNGQKSFVGQWNKSPEFWKQRKRERERIKKAREGERKKEKRVFLPHELLLWNKRR